MGYCFTRISTLLLLRAHAISKSMSLILENTIGASINTNIAVKNTKPQSFSGPLEEKDVNANPAAADAPSKRQTVPLDTKTECVGWLTA